MDTKCSVVRSHSTHRKRLIDFCFRHIRTGQMQDHLHTQLDDLLGESERPVRCSPSSTPCDGHGQRSGEGRGAKSADTVEEVDETRVCARGEELVRVEGALVGCYEGGEVHHGAAFKVLRMSRSHKRPS
jgi:hypothetical protein